MKYFQIAEIGFKIYCAIPVFPEGDFLKIFSVSEDHFNSLYDRIYINIQEADIHPPEAAEYIKNYFKWKESGQTYISLPFGHCSNAVSFRPSDWRTNRIELQLNAQIREESCFTLNQIFSISGLHSPLLARNALIVHSSYIAADFRMLQSAILFTGPSGMGKSTQAELWRRYAGAEIINGDRAVLKYGGIVQSADEREQLGHIWSAHGIPVCGSSNICKNISLPVGMIVVLKQGSENHVEEMTAGEKYRALLLASAFYQWDAYESEQAHRLVLKLIEEVPIVRLVCRPDEGAVHILKEYIEKKCRK